MSSRTSSRSTLTTVPSTIWPSSTSTIEAAYGLFERHAAEVVFDDLPGRVVVTSAAADRPARRCGGGGCSVGGSRRSGRGSGRTRRSPSADDGRLVSLGLRRRARNRRTTARQASAVCRSRSGRVLVPASCRRTRNSAVSMVGRASRVVARGRPTRCASTTRPARAREQAELAGRVAGRPQVDLGLVAGLVLDRRCARGARPSRRRTSPCSSGSAPGSRTRTR